MRTLTATVTITDPMEGVVIIGAGGTAVTTVTTASIFVFATTERVEIIARTIAHWGPSEQAWSTGIMMPSTFPRLWVVCPTLLVSLEAPGP